MISPAPHAISPLRHENIAPPDDGLDDDVDILDLPIPAQLHTFSSASSRGGGPVFPPGLEQHMTDMNLSNVNLWRESSSDMPSAASLGSGSSGVVPSTSALGHGNVDHLEDAPPRPREGWTHLRATGGNTVDSGRRTTLGQVMHRETDRPSDACLPHFSSQPILIDMSEPNGGYSEHGSLHSLAHINPFSASGSVNSRAPSRGTFYGSSMGSSSSRLSHFANLSHSSRPHSHLGIGAPSLQHSNSVSSEGRRRPRRSPGEPVSGSDSPYGSIGYQYNRARLSAIGGTSYAASSSMPQLSPFGGGFLTTSHSIPNLTTGSASHSGSNRSSNIVPVADLDTVSPPPFAFSTGRAGDRLGAGSIGATSMSATPTTASRTATTSEAETSACTSIASLETSRTTVGEGYPEGDIVAYVPGAMGTGPDPKQRGRFPNTWMRAGDYA